MTSCLESSEFRCSVIFNTETSLLLNIVPSPESDSVVQSCYVSSMANEPLQALKAPPSSRVAPQSRGFSWPAHCRSETSQRARLEALTQQRKASSTFPHSHSLYLCLAFLLPSLLLLQILGGVTLDPPFLAIPFSIASLAYRHRCGRQIKQDDPQLHCDQGRK